jgi:predicted transcriptional regulator
MRYTKSNKNIPWKGDNSVKNRFFTRKFVPAAQSLQVTERAGFIMSEKMKRLGDAELEIMLVIWQSADSVTSNFILDKLQGKRKWALSTLMTSLSRLADKGFVLCDRSTRTNLYSALVSEAEYKERESRSFLEKLYGNSLQSLVTSLYSSKVIDKTDILDLKEYLNQLEKERE